MPYIGNQPGTGVRNRFIYTATASQTTFSGADDNGKTLKYADSDFVDVFLNGVCLVPVTDYTSTSKTSIVLVQAASLNDTLEVIAYDIATISDTVSKADGGTFNGDLVITNASPDITLTNNTAEDTDGGRESTLTFKGLQSGGEESTLAEIRASHDGTSDDEKGDLIFKTNDGSDGASPTEVMRLDSGGTVNISSPSNARALKMQNGANNSASQITFLSDDGTEDSFIRNQSSSSAVDTLSLGTGGSERMRIDADGLVGIGRTPANSTVLDVEGDSSSTLRGLSIRNGNTGSGAAVSLIFSLNRTGGDVDFTAASITAHKVSSWTTTASTVDSYMTFSTINNETTAEKMRLDKDGNLLIGTTDSIVYNEGASGNSGLVLVGGTGYYSAARKDGPTSFLNRQVSTGDIINFYYNGSKKGSISTDGSNVAYNTSSDYRLKENVTDITDGITRLKQLAPKRFNFIGEPDKTVDGFLAHEAQTVIPEAITGTKDEVEVWKENEELPENVSVGDNKLDADGNTIPEYQGIDQSKLVPLLTAALQEAIAKIETLETKVAALEAE